jgi:hypothetical protein
MRGGGANGLLEVVKRDPILLESTGEVDGERDSDADRQSGQCRGYRSKGDAGDIHHSVGPQDNQRNRCHGEHAQERPAVTNPKEDHENDSGGGEGQEKR